jgi:hypothetical protein
VWDWFPGWKDSFQFLVRSSQLDPQTYRNELIYPGESVEIRGLPFVHNFLLLFTGN